MTHRPRFVKACADALALGRLIGGARQARQIHLQGAQALAQVFMQLAGDTQALGFARIESARPPRQPTAEPAAPDRNDATTWRSGQPVA